MLNLLSGVSPEIRVIMLFGFIGLIILIAGSVLIVGLRRQAIENSGRFDIPVRIKNPDKPKKVKREKRVKVKKEKPVKVKAEKAPKPVKVKAEKPTKVAKPEKAKKEKPVKAEKPKKGGFFKKAPKASGIALLAAPVGSAVAPERVAAPVVEKSLPVTPAVDPVVASDSSDDFDILPPTKSEPAFAAPASDDDFDFATFDAPVQQPQTPINPATTGGPFGNPAPAGDEEW